MTDPYATLGVARDAGPDEIRKAYRALAKQHHPDLNPGNAAAEARFKAVASANDLLSDPDKRARYDRGEIDAAGHERAPQPSWRDFAEGEDGRRYSRNGAGATGNADDGYDDMFASMFGADRAYEGRAQSPGRDALYAMDIDFLDAVNGATRRLTLPDGHVLDVAIPAATVDGGVLRLRGRGRPGRGGGPSGDALVEIHVRPHRNFVRDDRDIRLDLPISLKEAVLGGPVDVPTVGGVVRMRIPPGSDSGTELRLKGRGVPAHGGRPPGNQYVRLKVVVGAPDAALTAFLKDWKPEAPVDPRATMEIGS